MGCGILVAALVPLQRLIAQLAPGPIRRYWLALRALIFLFIAGYLGYASLHWDGPADLARIVVPVIFFFGACFVLAVATLSLRTALDVRRVAVLEHENITDALMGIHNRRYLERRLVEETQRAKRYGLPLSLLMIDIDHFKNINDTLGHQVGDLVLTGLGRLVGEVCRNSDVAARYGGEELCVIAGNTTAANAILFAERLRQAVECAALIPAGATGGGQMPPITISVGVAELSASARDAPGLLAAADKALYRAKNAGRNRVVFSQAPDS